MNTIEKISVRQLKDISLGMNSLDDDIILSNKIELRENLFEIPCSLDAFVLLFCADGKADIHINNNQYKIYPGILIFNVPENIIQISNTDNLKIYPIIISSDFIKKINIRMKELMKLYVFAKKTPFVFLERSEIITLEKYYFLLEDIILSKEEQKKYILEGIIQSLICKLSIIVQHYQNSKLDSSVKKRSEEIFESFIELLTKEGTTERNLLYYAEKIGITPNYLSKLVKEYTGRTAVEWIDEYIIFEAKTMIKHTQYTIQEIAYKLKFPSPSFFGKYFKRLTGISPKQYKLS